MIQDRGPLGKLVKELMKLPGVGEKTAHRFAYYIISMGEHEVEEMSTAMVQAKNKITRCRICGDFTEDQPCSICRDETRDESLICVVESPSDVRAFENLQEFNGRYHVLHGALSPMDGIGVKDLNLESLIERLRDEKIKEVIIATNPTTEGEATANYISNLFLDKDPGIKFTRLAYGISVGGDLDQTDPTTLLKAVQGRKEL